MEFWDTWALEAIGKATWVSNCSGLLSEWGSVGFLPDPSLPSSVSEHQEVTGSRLFKEIHVGVGRLVQLLLWFQKLMTLVSIFLLSPLYVQHTLNFPSVRGLIHFQRSTINITCYRHLWHQFYTLVSKTRLAISIFYVKFNLSKTWLSFQSQLWLCNQDHHLLLHNIDYRSMCFISILKFSSNYV